MKHKPILKVDLIKKDMASLRLEFNTLLANQKSRLYQVINLFEKFYTFLNRLKSGHYIETNPSLENFPDFIYQKYPQLIHFDIDPADVLDKEELRKSKRYQSYKEEFEAELLKSNKCATEVKIYFYAKLLPNFSGYLMELRKVLPTIIKTEIKNKDNFNELIEHIDYNYLKKEEHFEQSIECPFSNEQKGIFDYIISKYAPKNNVYFSYVYMAMKDYDIERGKELEKDKLKRKISVFFDPDFKKKYFSWLNQIYYSEFEGQITSHNNCSSQKKIDQIKQLIKDYRNNIS